MKICRVLAGACAILAITAIAAAQSAGTAFTYQGRIKQSGILTTGPVEAQFTLWTAETGGTQIGTTLSRTLNVNQGFFQTVLDFGSNAFDGSARWLQIAVVPTGGGQMVTVTPRQQINPSPYSVHAVTSAGNIVSGGNNAWIVGGNFGIGTASPANQLSVTGTANVTGNLGIGTTAPSIRLSLVDAGTGLHRPGSNVLAMHTAGSERMRITSGGNVGIGTTSPSLRLSLVDAGTGLHRPASNVLALHTNNNERMRIASNGNVGIGTTNPSQALHVAGTVLATGFSGSGASLTSLNANNITSGSLNAALLPGSGQWNITDSHFYIVGEGNNVLTIRPSGGSSGRVGIGTASPQNTLHVNGIGRITGNLIVGGDLTADSCNCSSDSRFKRDVLPLTHALDTVLSLQAVRYQWRIEKFPERFKAGERIGFIAQDVMERIPEVVIEDEDGYLAMDYGRLTPVLVEAVKELHAQLQSKGSRILEQESQLEAQQEQIDQLAARLSELEAMFERLATR